MWTLSLCRLLLIYARREPRSESYASVHRWSMKLLTVIGLVLNLVGVVILGMGEVLKGAAYLRSLTEPGTADTWRAGGFELLGGK